MQATRALRAGYTPMIRFLGKRSIPKRPSPSHLTFLTHH
jgi:hypothetical protein